MTFDDLYRARVNASAAIFGTALIIGLTRLTSLLPARASIVSRESSSSSARARMMSARSA